MQEDFISPKGYYANKPHERTQINNVTDKIIKSLPDLYKKYKICYIISEFRDKQFGDNKSICIKGYSGCNLVLDKRFANVIIKKNNLSAFSNKKYLDYLILNKTKKIFIMGVLTEYCIKETVLDALKESFEVILIEDCIATGGDEEENRINTIRELKEKGAVFYKLRNILGGKKLKYWF